MFVVLASFWLLLLGSKLQQTTNFISKLALKANLHFYFSDKLVWKLEELLLAYDKLEMKF
jgi:hypothetical protein